MVKAVGVVVLFLMMAFTAATVEGRHFNPNTLLAQMVEKHNGGEANYLLKSTTDACCNDCTCTKSHPPQCQCNDWRETCHSACKNCNCLLIYPPRCRCVDITSFCYDKCSSSAKPTN